MNLTVVLRAITRTTESYHVPKMGTRSNEPECLFTSPRKNKAAQAFSAAPLRVTQIYRVALEQVPQSLVVNRVVELHLRSLYYGSQFARRAVCRSLLQFDVTALHIGAQNLADPLRPLKVVNRRLNIVGQVTAAGAQILVFRNRSVNTGFEDA